MTNPAFRQNGEGERPLTEFERVGLRWMAWCNGLGVGYLGPTVKKSGPLPGYEALVRDELSIVRRGKTGEASGYWITDKGREALTARPSPKETGDG